MTVKLLTANFRFPNPNPGTYEVYGSNPIQLDRNLKCSKNPNPNPQH